MEFWNNLFKSSETMYIEIICGYNVVKNPDQNQPESGDYIVKMMSKVISLDIEFSYIPPKVRNVRHSTFMNIESELKRVKTRKAGEKLIYELKNRGFTELLDIKNFLKKREEEK